MVSFFVVFWIVMVYSFYVETMKEMCNVYGFS